MATFMPGTKTSGNVGSRKRSIKKLSKEEAIPTQASLDQFVSSHAATLTKIPKELLEKIKQTEETIEQMRQQEGRHTIRATKDLERELADLVFEKDRYESGAKRREYLANAKSYLEQYHSSSDEHARGNVADSLVRLAEDQTPIRFRKRSDLTRTIRMASLTNDRGVEQHSLHDEFLSEFHGHCPPVYIAHGDFCVNCDNVQLQRDTDATLICPQCGASVVVYDATASAVSWGDDMDYASFQYKRVNHFHEWLNTSMAKQCVDIPDDVLQSVMQRLAREKIRPEQIDAACVRNVLKELKLRKYYEHSLLLSCRLTGRSPPRLSPAQEEQLKSLFSKIQAPFERVRDKLAPDRKNFLSYSYVLYKFCELLGLDEFRENFALLKGKDKLHKQDVLFKAICEELDWAFVPSV